MNHNNICSLKSIVKKAMPKKIANNSVSFLTNIPMRKKFLKKVTIKSSSKKDEQIIDISQTNQNNQTNQTNRVMKPKYISPIKSIPSNNKFIIEKYLISASLLTKDSHIDNSNFDINYYKRISQKNSPITNKRGILSKVLANNIRETYKKNILIGTLKKKREELKNNERSIQLSFRERQNEIDNYFNSFAVIEDEYKTIKRNEERILNYYRVVYLRTRSEYMKEVVNNKRLRDTIEKTIRDIYKVKEYYDFIHKVFNISSPMSKINEDLFYANKFDILCEKFVNCFDEKELKNEDMKKEKYLEDINIFIQNLDSTQDNIMQLLKEQEIIVNKIYKIKHENNSKIRNLLLKISDYKNDENELITLRNNYNNEIINTIKVNVDEYMNDVLKYIIDFAKITDVPTSNTPELESMPIYVKYCKDILASLRNKELLLDKYMKEIECISKSKDENEKNNIEQTIVKVNKINIKKHQKMVKLNRAKEYLLNRMKTINKINKKTIIGKRALVDYRSFNMPKKQKPEVIVDKETTNNNFLHCLSVDDIK